MDYCYLFIIIVIQLDIRSNTISTIIIIIRHNLDRERSTTKWRLTICDMPSVGYLIRHTGK